MNCGPFYATWSTPNQLPTMPFRHLEAMQALRAAGGSSWDRIVDRDKAVGHYGRPLDIADDGDSYDPMGG